MSTINHLKPITQRLNNTPVQDLPRYAGFLASCILQCPQALSELEGQKGDNSVVIHKLKTRVSSLLQDRTQEGRFTGIVLAKAIIDANGLDISASTAAWTRMLLSCLNKQDAPETKKLAIITLARIFLLTVDQPASIRDVTTPNLPTFIATTLGLIRPIEISEPSPLKSVTSPLLDIVLESWVNLMCEFPTMFRPYLKSFRAILLSLLGDAHTPLLTRNLAAEMFASLPFCAPKNSVTAEWSELCAQVITSAHQTANVLFRSVLEDWRPDVQRAVPVIAGKVSSEVKTKAADVIGMENWSGMASGTTRLTTLLKLLTISLTIRQSQPMTVPLASVMELSERLAGVVPPNKGFSMQTNADISRDERENLWTHLPIIHSSTAGMLHALVEVYGQLLRPISQTIILQLFEIYEAQKFDGRVSEVIFDALMEMLQRGLVQLTRQPRIVFGELVSQCCNDLRNALPQSNNLLNQSNEETSRLRISQKRDSSAWRLLPAILTYASSYLTSSLRTEIDSCIILVGHKEAMLASVLNPPPSKKGARTTPSILPFLARIQNGDIELEALLRPRMPIIQSSHDISMVMEDNEDTVTDQDEDIALVGDMAEANEGHFETSKHEHPDSGMTITPKPLSKRPYDVVLAEADEQESTEVMKHSKRAKADSDAMESDQKPSITTTVFNASNVVEVDEALVDATLEPELQVDTGPAAPPPSTIPTPLLNISQEVSATINPSAAIRTPANTLGEDSDDDEEIPTIDATMSDDDEEEDESMDE